MKYEHKKALFVFGMGFLLFWLFRPKLNKIAHNTNLNHTNSVDNPANRKKINSPTISEKTLKANPQVKDAFGCLKAYIEAYNNGEPQNVLDELNREFAKEFKVKVYIRKSDGKMVVCDLSGKEILVNN